MMEDVLSDSMYMQKEVRHIIFRYYMNGITSEMRLQYWTMGKFSFGSEERRILYELILSKPYIKIHRKLWILKLIL